MGNSVHPKLQSLWIDRPVSWVTQDPEKFRIRSPSVSPLEFRPQKWEPTVSSRAVSSDFWQVTGFICTDSWFAGGEMGACIFRACPAVCLTFPFQLCKVAWIITADTGYSPPSSSVPSFLLIELWFCPDVGWPRASGLRLATGGVNLDQIRPAIIISRLPVVGLGIDMWCNSDQKERSADGLLRKLLAV